MLSAVTDKWLLITQLWRAAWLTGPMLGKELRVASRQRKYYLLRLAYVGLLCAVVFHFWHVIVQVGGGASGVGQASRSGEAGKRVIVTIVWFQFVTAQVLAIVLLSDAISSEVRRRTLDALLVTPLGAVQIVLGKLVTRLLQVVLLLAISLPVLAVARAFGGVPWDYVVSGLCITFSVSVLVGSLSLYYSIHHQHAHRVVRDIGYWYLVYWGADIMDLAFWARSAGARTPSTTMSLISPFSALLARTQVIFTGPTTKNAPAPLPLHCLLLLVIAVIVLVCSVRRVRRFALDPTCLPGDASSRNATALSADPWKAMKLTFTTQEVRRVTDPPIVWKELGVPLFPTQDQTLFRTGLWAAVGPLAVAVIVVARVEPLIYELLSALVWILQWVFILRLGVAAACSVAREKEAHTWPVLLTTPLDSGEIVKGKVIGCLRRNLSLLIPLLAIYALAFLSAPPGERGLLHQVVNAGTPTAHLAGITLFLLGAGLYAGLRCRTTTAAMAYVFGAFLCLMLLASQLPSGGLRMPAHDQSGNLPGTGVLSLLLVLVYGGVGLLGLRESACTLRRNVFQ